MSSELESFYKDFNPNLQSFFQEAADEENTQKFAPIHDEMKDDSTSRFVNKKYVATGGMKKIVSADDMKTHRTLAIAELKEETEDIEVYERFLREARITAALQHPNIIPVYDIDLDQFGKPFFAMRLLKGDTLTTILKELKKSNPEYKRVYPLSELLDVFIKICEAVAYAHSHSIIHQDLKPSNIQIGEFGEVLVCDWGLAKIINDYDEELFGDSALFDQAMLNDITLSGTIKGTPGYMAPEQIDMKLGEKGPATDIYSLGCILFSILTYNKPVYAKSTQEVLEKTTSGKVQSPQIAYPHKNIPDSLDAVCTKAMALKPEERYEDVIELIEDIKAYQNGFATSAESPSFFRALHLMVLRHKTAAFFVLIVMIISLVMGIKIVQNERRAVANAEKAVSALKLYEEEKVLREELARKAIPLRENFLKLNYENMSPQDMLDLANDLVLNGSKDVSVHAIKAVALFSLLRFDEASQVFADKVPNNYFDTIRKYSIKAKQWVGDSGTLAEKDALKLIKLLLKTKTRKIAPKFVLSYFDGLPDGKSRAEFIGAVLAVDSNPYVKTPVYKNGVMDFSKSEELNKVRLLLELPVDHFIFSKVTPIAGYIKFKHCKVLEFKEDLGAAPEVIAEGCPKLKKFIFHGKFRSNKLDQIRSSGIEVINLRRRRHSK